VDAREGPKLASSLELHELAARERFGVLACQVKPFDILAFRFKPFVPRGFNPERIIGLDRMSGVSSFWELKCQFILSFAKRDCLLDCVVMPSLDPGENPAAGLIFPLLNGKLSFSPSIEAAFERADAMDSLFLQQHCSSGAGDFVGRSTVEDLAVTGALVVSIFNVLQREIKRTGYHLGIDPMASGCRTSTTVMGSPASVRFLSSSTEIFAIRGSRRNFCR